ATIPLGFAGAGFEAAAIDPSGQIALLGSAVHRELYAIDLRALDDPLLYANDDDPPVKLDGTAGFPDARIFSAEAPLVLPDRVDRPSTPDCAGFTHVTTNSSGTEAYATDFCDGTFTRVRLDLGGAPPIPFPPHRRPPPRGPPRRPAVRAARRVAMKRCYANRSRKSAFTRFHASSAASFW